MAHWKTGSALRLLLIAAAVLVCGNAYGQGNEAQPDMPDGSDRVIRVGRATGPIHIDGRLDDPAWEEAQSHYEAALSLCTGSGDWEGITPAKGA